MASAPWLSTFTLAIAEVTERAPIRGRRAQCCAELITSRGFFVFPDVARQRICDRLRGASDPSRSCQVDLQAQTIDMIGKQYGVAWKSASSAVYVPRAGGLDKYGMAVVDGAFRAFVGPQALMQKV